VGVESSNDVPGEHKVAKCCNPNFAAYNTKMGIIAFSMGICLAKCLTRNISDTMRDRVMVSN